MNSYESHRQRLIVAADDFGISARANRNTLYLISLGKIDRVGVMVHGTISAKEIDELNRSGVKIDIHLDILHELGADRKKRQSSIGRGIEFLGKLLTGKVTTKKVEQDWRNQIELFKKIFGRSPDGINSHEHVHFFPPFFKVALNLEKEYDIPYIRFGSSMSMRHHMSVSHILHYLRHFDKRACEEASCVSSGALVSLDWLSDMDFFLDNLPEGTIEIACHPELAEDFVKIKKYF